MPNQIEKIWQVRPAAGAEILKKHKEHGPVAVQLLFNRNLLNEKDIECFLKPSFEDAGDPYLFSNMAAAVELIVSHIKAGDRMVVYGDYDADGVTSAACLWETLEALKAKASVYIPDRVSEGYGLNKKAVEEIAAGGARLIITVDGGIRNKAEVEAAKAAGVAVIVTDHHIPPENEADLPDCLIINPAVKKENYPFRYLAGVGVAFKLAEALIKRSKLDDADKQKLVGNVLDLAAVGTVADCVSLTGENRLLVKKGLEELNKRKRVGLDELIKAAQLNGDRKLDAWNIGFQIAPRLNAAGRMDHANTAFELLITKDRSEAAELAGKLNEKNVRRQAATEEIAAQVEEQVKEEDKIIIGVCPKEINAWQEGVIGLVAGRLAEKYYKPCLIITKTEDGYKGSGRSIPEFNLIAAIEAASEHLEKYGGHPSACGFSLKEETLDGFRQAMAEAAVSLLAGVDLRPKLAIEAIVGLKDMSEELAETIERFAPFGQNNDKPKLLCRGAAVLDKIFMGADGQHLKLKLKSADSPVISAIGFGQSERWQELEPGCLVDLVAYLEINEFNGKREAQLKIIDIKYAE